MTPGLDQTIAPNPSWTDAHAPKRTERHSHANRPRQADGPDVPLLLAPGTAGGGTAGKRMSSGARQDSLRAAAGVPRYRWKIRADRRVLRPPRRLALVREERGA